MPSPPRRWPSLSRYYNSVSVARWFGTPQIAENADDIARFGRRSPAAITEPHRARQRRRRRRQPHPPPRLLEDADARSATINLHAIATSAGGSVGAGAAAALLAEAQAATMRAVTMFAAGTPSEVKPVAIVDKVTTDAAPGRWTTTVEPPGTRHHPPHRFRRRYLAVLDTGRVGFWEDHHGAHRHAHHAPQPTRPGGAPSATGSPCTSRRPTTSDPSTRRTSRRVNAGWRPTLDECNLDGQTQAATAVGAPARPASRPPPSPSPHRPTTTRPPQRSNAMPSSKFAAGQVLTAAHTNTY